MEQQKYWQSFGQREGSEAHKELSKNEFQEDLDGGLFDSKTPRRDFLKYLGFSTAAAALAASCEMPVRKSIPFLNKPEDVIPGMANYYATTFVQDGDVTPVVARVMDGRPIKLEGNELSSITGGGTSARVQASVLSLYDVNRLRFPKAEGHQEATFEAVDKKIGAALQSVKGAGKPIVLLTTSLNSPTIQAAIDDFTKAFPSTKQVTYDAVSYNGVLLAAEATYGKRVIPSYLFDKAKVIVSIDCDFLGTWLSPVDFARAYAQGRKISDSKADMSKHFHFEGNLSLTGSNADERYTYKPSEIGAVVLGLYQALGGAATAPAISNDRLTTGIAQAAAALKGAGAGNGLVVSGNNDPNVQILVNAMNSMIGADGKTIDWSSPVAYRQGIDADMVKLVDDMNAGSIGALLIFGPNPVYNYYDSAKFKSGLEKVGLTVSFPTVEDETATLCNYILPVNHFLESWGDAEVKAGFVAFQQPTISPLFKTRPFAESLLKWSGSDKDYDTYFKDYWLNLMKGDLDMYEKTIQAGVWEYSAPGASLTFSGAKVADAVTALAAMKPSTGTEVVLYQKVSLGDGAMANNPWLQEMPDPITRITWDNYAVISPKMADSLGIKLNDHYEVEINKPLLNVTVGGKTLGLAAIVIPGQHPEVIGVALGYGRDKRIGRAGGDIGFNAYPWVTYSGTSFVYSATSAMVVKTDDTYKIAQVQNHNSYEGRTSVIKEATLKTFTQSPEVFQQMNKELEEEYGEDFRHNGTLYQRDQDILTKPGIAWGMSVDLNSCIGCGACVVACIAENNVSVVGKKQVAKMHEMQWLRIDRYFSGDPDHPDVVFQPMMCQHCDNAPCENVCPVSATNHSSEGLNQMAYNRCIGTRYCANNCPYKVRRFNWYDWNGADVFPNNQVPVVEEGWLDGVIMDMNDPLSRMVLNPDVVVRSRGVMEKCSFCVQRLQAAKLEAKVASRPLLDGEARTACMQACPTQAIIFGNANDKDSKISQIRATENTKRKYYALEELHVLPNVNYLAKVRNTDREIGMTMDKEA